MPEKGLIEQIEKTTGKKISSLLTVGGGDINQAYRLESSGDLFFLKVNDAAQFPDMFKKEAEGLKALAASRTFRIPEVVQAGEWEGRQFLVLEWVERGRPSADFHEKTGSLLAAMHQQKQENFGWHEDNYIGSLVQPNNKADNWAVFYAEQRILPFVKKLRDAGHFEKKDVAGAEAFCKQLPALFPEEPPALLHGDLWSGNYLADAKGEPVLIDPAVYCGHREMDIGMTLLFGGFSGAFYHSYNAQFPLAEGWQQRVSSTQIFPLLVHARLFGGHYTAQCRNFFQKWVKP